MAGLADSREEFGISCKNYAVSAPPGPCGVGYSVKDAVHHAGAADDLDLQMALVG
jgi:hypothetical protein